jgi:hypothetical protein
MVWLPLNGLWLWPIAVQITDAKVRISVQVTSGVWMVQPHAIIESFNEVGLPSCGPRQPLLVRGNRVVRQNSKLFNVPAIAGTSRSQPYPIRADCFTGGHNEIESLSGRTQQSVDNSALVLVRIGCDDGHTVFFDLQLQTTRETGRVNKTEAVQLTPVDVEDGEWGSGRRTCGGL